MFGSHKAFDHKRYVEPICSGTPLVLALRIGALGARREAGRAAAAHGRTGRASWPVPVSVIEEKQHVPAESFT